MAELRDPFAQLTRTDVVLLGQLSLQLHEQADGCMSGEDPHIRDIAGREIGRASCRERV